MSECFIAGLGFYPVYIILLGRTGEEAGFITTLVYFVSRCSIAQFGARLRRERDYYSGL